MQPVGLGRRRAFVLLYAIGVMVMVMALGLFGLESGQRGLDGIEAALLRQLASDAAASGVSYARGYVRYVVHQINLAEQRQAGAVYPGAGLEPWCVDTARPQLAVHATGPRHSVPFPRVRFEYGRLFPEAAAEQRPRYTVAFSLRLNESLHRNRFFLSGLEIQPAPAVLHADSAVDPTYHYPDPPSSILYRVECVGEVFAHHPTTGVRASEHAAREVIVPAFNVRLRDIDVRTQGGRFVVQEHATEVRNIQVNLLDAPPASLAIDEDGFF